MDAIFPGDWYGDLGNEVLYRMCRENPLHLDRDVIHSKLWLIGRSYSVAIERKARYPKQAMRLAIDELLKSDIDKRIASVKEIRRAEFENVAEVLELHGLLTGIFCEATGIQKRSLASKYLHFHAPDAVFIYDSIVSGNLHRISKESKFDRVDEIRIGVDAAYAQYVFRALKYRDEILEPKLKRQASPREVDKSLYR